MGTIGIDAHCLNEQRTGVATYVANLVSALEHIAPKAPIDLYVKKSLDASGFNQVIIRDGKLCTSLRLPLYLATHKRPEVMLYPAHVMPLYSPFHSVVTIHDLAFELFPDYFT